MTKPRILMAAHTTAAGQQLVEIARAIIARNEYVLDVYMQEPAARWFREAGLAHVLLADPAKKSDENARISQEQRASQLLATRPDLIITGLSTMHDMMGIDELLQENFTGPCLIMQDAPGVTSFIKGGNIRYLCTTQEGVDMTKAQGDQATLIGSPRIAGLREHDYAALANQFRNTYAAASKGRSIVAVQTQHLTQFEGYRNIMRDFAVAAAALNVFVVQRPHPQEFVRPGHMEEHRKIFNEVLKEKNWVREDAGVSEFLSGAGASVVATYSSLGLASVVHAAHFAKAPLAVPFMMLTNPAMDKELGVIRLPQLEEGRGITVTNAADVKNMLDEALDERTRVATWQAAKRMPIIGNAVDHAMDAIRRALPQRRPFAAKPSMP